MAWRRELVVCVVAKKESVLVKLFFFNVEKSIAMQFGKEWHKQPVSNGLLRARPFDVVHLVCTCLRERCDILVVIAWCVV
jgi:hypothetical protein